MKKNSANVNQIIVSCAWNAQMLSETLHHALCKRLLACLSSYLLANGLVIFTLFIIWSLVSSAARKSLDGYWKSKFLVLKSAIITKSWLRWIHIDVTCRNINVFYGLKGVVKVQVRFRHSFCIAMCFHEFVGNVNSQNIPVTHWSKNTLHINVLHAVKRLRSHYRVSQKNPQNYWKWSIVKISMRSTKLNPRVDKLLT